MPLFLPVGDQGSGQKAADAASHHSAAADSAQLYLSYVLERYWLSKVEEKLIFERI